ncbi:MAG: HAMP domain-containing sensor histidine kinase [Clostridia bacterium]|nr:HAMP domain-containing sensor histidine kinase [Clostridia bacterium]
MKKTLFRQLLFYMLLFGIILSAVSWLFIELFFDNYYYSQQKKLLVSHSEQLVDVYRESGFSNIQGLIEEFYLDHGMSVHFIDTETGTVYGTDSQGSGRQNMLSTAKNAVTEEVFISTTGSANNPKDWLSYVIKTSDGNIVLSRISYTSMDSVVGLVQTFFLYFGLLLGTIFIIFAYIFSKSMSKPLKELNEIAQKMGRLDFTLKYEGKRKDEIGTLGKTLNEITDQLENTISQLQGELSKERTLDKMKTQFTAQVSHELQTPLSVIKGYAEALSDEIYSSEETPAVYEILLTETNKITGMVDDLLDLSQMESGAYIIRKSRFAIYSMLEKLFNRHKNLPYDKDFKMIINSMCDRNFLYSGDEIRLEQAVRNILSNAIKHVDDNGVIHLEADCRGPLTISIFNSGGQIPEKDLPFIFDSYYQGSNKRSGTGLGLAISSHIIKLHGGTLDVLNTGDGVQFKITLPY